ncbi:MAG: hypothetical protein ACP5D2_03180 [Candidatus Nanoarchaeia archaeon]
MGKSYNPKHLRDQERITYLRFKPVEKCPVFGNHLIRVIDECEIREGGRVVRRVRN